MRRKCSCGDVQEAIVDCEGHSYVITQKKESTCQNEGTVKYLCSVCGYELTETVPTSSHNYEKNYASKSWLQWLIETLLDILFGYEGDRGYYYKCVDCNHIATVDEKVSDSTSGVLSSCNHVLGDWIVIKEASCNDGYSVKYLHKRA
jgi:DNA-directed RNA polymerase subunit RPC12/RpoP